MTTKIEHSIINKTPHYYPKPSLMDRFLESQKIESMRKKMLMQEQLFKHQVQELHRLYNQQKKMMQEIENGLKQQKETRDVTEPEGTPSSSTHRFEDEVEVELTLSIGHCTRKRRSKSAEIQGSDVASSSSTGVYEETRRPHWLLQDLSLNRT
ncbi:hypothetical protein SASPL_112107 [Salvia splendens]|uniref:Uncharacterized protein n=1 Tax=Salvia splendens TaxID=180675 RepID=A0A8X8Y7K9_SALSN|nr:uncharacterized protein LOC121799093 [Salvia splendens]KAG6427860.1 hypothetical protein SASPL_112107 [Salvia splendens]